MDSIRNIWDITSFKEQASNHWTNFPFFCPRAQERARPSPALSPTNQGFSELHQTETLSPALPAARWIWAGRGHLELVKWESGSWGVLDFMWSTGFLNISRGLNCTESGPA